MNAIWETDALKRVLAWTSSISAHHNMAIYRYQAKLRSKFNNTNGLLLNSLSKCKCITRVSVRYRATPEVLQFTHCKHVRTTQELLQQCAKESNNAWNAIVHQNLRATPCLKCCFRNLYRFYSTQMWLSFWKEQNQMRNLRRLSIWNLGV